MAPVINTDNDTRPGAARTDAAEIPGVADLDEGERELLTRTGSGGVIKRGYVSDEPLISYLGADERPAFVFATGKPLVREAAGESRTLSPGSGYRTVVVVSDTRVLAVVGEDAGEDHAVAIPHAETETVEVDRGMLSSRVRLTTTREATWTLPLGDADADAVGSYLDEASWAWTRVETSLHATKKGVVEVSGHLEAGEVDRAVAALERASDRFERAMDAATEFQGRPRGALARRIRPVRETLRETRSRVRRGRAEALVQRAEAAWRGEDYDAAHDAYTRAREECTAALSLCEGADAVAVQDEIDRIERHLDRLEATPVRRADRARERAEAAEEPVAAADHWAAALDRYRTALELDWGREERRFDGDHDRLRERAATATRRLLAARRSAADHHRSEAEAHVDQWRHELATERYRRARDQLREGLALAREFHPDETDALRAELSAVERRLSQVLDASPGLEAAGSEADLPVE